MTSSIDQNDRHEMQSGVGAARGSRLRLTKRGRAVIALVTVGPLVAIALALSLNGGAATASGSEPAVLDYVTISSGESLWAIATDLAPNEDPREVIAQIQILNKLAGSDVDPGQKLAIPAKYSR